MVAFLAVAADDAAADDTVEQDDLERFVRHWAADLDEFWKEQLREQGYKYRSAAIEIFDRAVKTGCGPRLAKQGLVYCTEDLTVYVPPRALMEFRDELGVAGDMAQAVGLAHEMAHHAQLGLHLTRKAARNSARTRSARKKRELKIAHELQADCFAGVWAHSLESRSLLEDGDVEEAIAVLEAIGDDALGVPARRWKHGSGAQRAHWFSVGYETGDITACDPITHKEK